MRLLLAFCLCAAMMLRASSIPMEVVRVLAHPPTPAKEPQVVPETGTGDDRADIETEQSEKSLMKRITKPKVINLPSKGLQIVLLPWKCYPQSSCQQKPVCAPSTAGGKTVCSIKCYACRSCVQPKITRQKLVTGKIKETRKSYIRTHRCGMCVSKSECTTTPCPKPKPCTLHRGKD